MDLASSARERLQTAFRPKTMSCYRMLFRPFVAFCVILHLFLNDISVEHVLSFLEYLTRNGVTMNMIGNYISAAKAHFTMNGLDHSVWSHKNVKYFLKSLKLTRPIVLPKRNIINVETLNKLIQLCDVMYMGRIFKAVFLLAFFGFLRLSNIAPHSLHSFDSSRHLMAGDIVFTKDLMKVVLKWSKTNQFRDKVDIISLPRIRGSNLYPYKACRAAMKLYSPGPSEPLFQFPVGTKWRVLTDSRIRKCLSILNTKLGFPAGHFTFHSFRRSGATLAYNAHIPLQHIKQQGTWVSDCVWLYIQKGKKWVKIWLSPLLLYLPEDRCPTSTVFGFEGLYIYTCM